MSNRYEGGAGAPSHCRLENARLLVEIDEANGSLNCLVNKSTSQNYIKHKDRARIFRLSVPLADRLSGLFTDPFGHAFESWEQCEQTIERTRTDTETTITVRYPFMQSEAGKWPIRAQYTVALSDGIGEVRLQLVVSNDSGNLVEEVFFPWICGCSTIESQPSDELVYPNVIRRVCDLFPVEQGGNWEEHPPLPGPPFWPSIDSMAMPWVNYGGKHEGFYLRSLDTTGLRHNLIVQNFASEQSSGLPVLGLSWNFVTMIGPGETWTSPEVVIGVHTGDWHVAADRYRESLAGWYQIPATPLAFQRSIASYNSAFSERDFGQISRLATDISRHGLSELQMWHFGNYYPKVLEPDYLASTPPRLGLFTKQYGGEANLRAAVKTAAQQGVAVGIIFSQRLWNRDVLTPELEGLADSWALRRQNGAPVIETWAHHHFGGAQWTDLKSRSYFGANLWVMCCAVNEWQDFAISNIVELMKRSGYSRIFYDQAVEQELCLSPGHQHQSPSASVQESVRFLARLKRAMRALDPDAVLIGEGAEVLASQVLDLGWCWSTRTNPSPTGAHPNPEVFRYTLPWARFAMPLDDDITRANRLFVLGMYLAVVPRSLETRASLSSFPDFARHVHNLIELHRRVSSVVVDGVFMDDVGLATLSGFAKVYRGKEEVGILVANETGTAARCRFKVRASLYGIDANTYRFDSFGNTVARRARREGDDLSVSLELGPHEVGAATFRASAWGSWVFRRSAEVYATTNAPE